MNDESVVANANCGAPCAAVGAVDDKVAAGAGALTKKSPVPTLPAAAPAAPVGRCILRTPLALVEAAGVLGAVVCAFVDADGVLGARGDATGGSGVPMLLLLLLPLLGAELGATPWLRLEYRCVAGGLRKPDGMMGRSMKVRTYDHAAFADCAACSRTSDRLSLGALFD